MELIKDLPSVFQEFEESRRNGFLEAKRIKDEGHPLVGTYCTFVPTEITSALGIHTVSLCSFSEEPISEAEQDLPANLCPLIKSSYGFAKSQKCPYFYFADLVIGETTCDGKKKMYEMLSAYKDVYVMQLPNALSDAARTLWISEIKRLKEYLEQKFETELSEEQLWGAIHEKNRERVALDKFAHLMALDPPPMKSRDLYAVLYGSSYEFDKMDLPERIDAMIEKIMQEYDAKGGAHKPRILVTGCPIGGDTEKVIDAIEANGGAAVAFENCGGAKPIATLVDESASDPYEALADKYLGIGCACFSPNPKRLALLSKMIDEYRVDGVIEMVLHACHTYSVESFAIANFCTKEKGIPYLSVETDYSQSDIEQLNTRVGAFIEMLG